MGYWPASAASSERLETAAAADDDPPRSPAVASPAAAHTCASSPARLPPALPAAIEAYLARGAPSGEGGRREPVVCFTVGSLAAIGAPAVPDPRGLLETVQGALELAGTRGVVLMERGTALSAAWAGLCAAAEVAEMAEGQPWAAEWRGVLGVAGSIPHALLFPRRALAAPPPPFSAAPAPRLRASLIATPLLAPPHASLLTTSRPFAPPLIPHSRRCAAVIHHGGSGTCAAAVLAAAPQVMVPHMLDQFFWAVCARPDTPAALFLASLHGQK